MGKYKEIADLAQEALVLTVIGDTEAAADVLGRIAENGPQAIHASMGGWAAVAHGILNEGDTSREGWYIEVTDERTGNVVGIDDTSLPREQRDAIRIMTLQANQDHDTLIAITKAYLEDEDPSAICDLMLAVLKLAAEAARYSLDQSRGGEA